MILTLQAPLSGRSLGALGSCYGQTVLAILAVQPILAIPAGQAVLAVGSRPSRHSVESRLPRNSVPTVQSRPSHGARIALLPSRSCRSLVTHPVHTRRSRQAHIPAVTLGTGYARQTRISGGSFGTRLAHRTLGRRRTVVLGALAEARDDLLRHAAIGVQIDPLIAPGSSALLAGPLPDFRVLLLEDLAVVGVEELYDGIG